MQIVGVIVFVLCFLFIAFLGVIIDFLFTTVIEKYSPKKKRAKPNCYHS